LLQCFASGYKINASKFGEYALDTARKLISLYPRYYLPPSVHKILVHAPDVTNYALVPIGELSEEAAESKNKDIKMFRRQQTGRLLGLKHRFDTQITSELGSLCYWPKKAPSFKKVSFISISI